MSAIPSRRLPWGLASAAVLVVGLGLTLTGLYLARTGHWQTLITHQALIPLSALTYALLGGLIAARQPRHLTGWAFLATALLLSINTLANSTALYESLPGVMRLPWSRLAAWATHWVWIPGLVLPGMMLMYFPTGQLPSPRWRPLMWLTAASVVTGVAAIVLHQSAIPTWGLPGLNRNGSAPLDAVLDVVLNVSGGVIGLGLLSAMAAVGLRLRRAQGLERAQIKSVAYAAAVLLVLCAGVYIASDIWLPPNLALEVGIAASSLLILGQAVAVGVAILRYRLYDIDLVINRTLVYSALTVAVTVLYVLMVGGLGVLLQAQGSLLLSLIGVGLVAILAQPVRHRVQRAVNRLMYGERDNPYAVLSRLGQRLEATLAPEAVLRTLVETVAQALKLPYVALQLKQDDVFVTIAEQGRASGTERLHLPLSYQGEAVGLLELSPRASGEVFSPADRQLLDDLARQAGVAVYAVGLTLALQRSRERLVTTREEERRRLRRDLHDGLGSQLSALHLRAGTLRQALPPSQPEAAAGLLELQTEIHSAIGDLRRLVYALRPPALDELGLAGALRSLAAQCSSADGLRVQVAAAEPLPPLPAAVEAAAYRIVQEALANVVRHAHAHTGQVRLAVSGGLCLDVIDDGVGLPAERSVGVGLRSMRERAEEVGGTCTVQPAAGGGTHVSIHLPLPVGGA